MAENQTEQPPVTPGRNTGVTLQRPFIVAMLFLLNFVFGFSVIVGTVLAYIWRSEAETEEWEKTHYTYLIRTFWIGLVFGIVAMFAWLGAFFAMIPFEAGRNQPPNPATFAVFFSVFIAWFVAAAWFCTRCILSLMKSGNRQAMPNPKTWLF